ncbi:MAG: helix-turn-helix domain-containing protein [Candidatus Bathyarchaeota archaeon]|nr:helix-turn-helix domain-containing protein [Candidatus Bathyarchaeota archaeon]
MTYREKENFKAPEEVLKEAGFRVSEKCCCRPSCFDYAARKNEKVIFIKFQHDIDNFSQTDSEELKLISKSVSATSVLISEKTRKKTLEDDTVYSRYNIFAVTPKTFENIILRNIHPLIQAAPGGYYVEINWEAVKRRRQELGMSVGEMAEMIGISRRTLYGYERGLAKASVSAAYNLVYTLGIPVAKSINIFEKSKEQRKCFLSRAGQAITRNKLLQKIFRKFSRYNITAVKKAPFDFVVTVPEDKMRIIGGIANNNEKELNKRVDEIISVSKIVKAHPILITEGRKPTNKDIACIYKEEIAKIKNPEDLIRL